MESRVLYEIKKLNKKKDFPPASLIFTGAEIASDVKICSFHRGTLFPGMCTATDGLLKDKKIHFQEEYQLNYEPIYTETACQSYQWNTKKTHYYLSKEVHCSFLLSRQNVTITGVLTDKVLAMERCRRSYCIFSLQQPNNPPPTPCSSPSDPHSPGGPQRGRRRRWALCGKS